MNKGNAVLSPAVESQEGSPNMDTKKQRWWMIPVTLIFLWYLCGVIMIWWPSFVYRVVPPVKVIAVHGDNVQLELTRWARWPMQATCTRKIACENVVVFPAADCPVNVAGQETQRKTFPLPIAAFNGSQQVTCRYSGVITLLPLSNWRPEILVPWVSESFVADKPAQK